ncbi:MAG: hypothetical protein KJ574_00155 [Nanoarchaeota archaeon]|nr:hypothetical protein [Nanoarchaeota archaeon]
MEALKMYDRGLDDLLIKAGSCLEIKLDELARELDTWGELRFKYILCIPFDKKEKYGAKYHKKLCGRSSEYKRIFREYQKIIARLQDQSEKREQLRKEQKEAERKREVDSLLAKVEQYYALAGEEESE